MRRVHQNELIIVSIMVRLEQMIGMQKNEATS